MSVGIQGYPTAGCTLNLPGGVKAIAGGGYHTIALKENGDVWTWGINNYGQLGDNSTTDHYYSVRVKGENGVGFLTGIKAIASGFSHTIALKENGEVWAWGQNNAGQIGDNTSGVGNDRWLPVRVKGENGVGFLTGVKAIAGGWNHTIALQENGDVWAWGLNNYGQLGDNSTTKYSYPIRVKGENGVGFLTGVKAIAGGKQHTVALKENGEVWAWGYNEYGQVGDNTNLNRYFPVRVKGENGVGFLTGVKVIADGWNYVIAIKENGDIWAWGQNNAGQLGDNSTTHQKFPVRVKVKME